MIDSLSILFFIIILAISCPILIYSLGYLKEYAEKYSTSYHYGLMITFILCMCGVVFAENSIIFMIFWEGMSISSFFLVIYEYQKSESLKAGYLYFIMTRISGLALFMMFAFIYQFTGSIEFDVIKTMGSTFTLAQKNTIGILALIGFGTKAGLLPMHVWLPKAHPAAPANISALMSGVMIKMALYGFIRINFSILTIPTIETGIATMIIGACSGVYAIINGAIQNDIKKLLGFSSVENIGIIFATVGLAMIMSTQNLPHLATLALTAAIFQGINHAVFKSLLFTSAGSVIFATGTKNMNELGGLSKTMKFTTFCAFIGTASIAALPPLNGFASEIIIFQSFIESGLALKNGTNIALVVTVFLAAIFLALTSGNAMYAAVKNFGITFLSNPRSDKAMHPHKIPLSMKIGLGCLTFYCVILGVGAIFFLPIITHIAASAMNLTIIPTISPIGYEIIPMTLLLFGLFALIVIVGNKKTKEATETNISWACGFNRGKPFMQYSGTGFTQPILRVIPYFMDYKKQVTKDEQQTKVSWSIIDLIEVYVYQPIAFWVKSIASKITGLQTGKIHTYIMYLLITLVITLFFVI